MSYPSLPIDATGSAQQPKEDLVFDRWPNGNVRVRSYFVPGKFSWKIKHGVLVDSDRATLKAFYDANKLLTFDFVSPWDSTTYHNVGFTKPPTYEFMPGNLWNVTLEMEQMF